MKQARCLTQLLRPFRPSVRYAHRRRPPVKSLLPRDATSVVRQAHEKERFAFKYAIDQGDVASAYQIYIEQREVPVLSGADVTSIVQLIQADAVRREWNAQDQPQAMKDVLWTIIDDVRYNKVEGQAILWAYALDALATWRDFDAAEELFTWLRTLPNRQNNHKTAHCIDSRVYGQMIKLRMMNGAKLGELRALRDEALVERELESSRYIAQSMIQALIQYNEVGEALKLLDHTAVNQRDDLRPQFYSSIISTAMETNLTLAVEIFMKSCKANCPPGPVFVTTLISALSKASRPLDTITSVFRRYREVQRHSLPMHIVNTVIGAIFSKRDAPVDDILTSVHDLIKQSKSDGSEPNITTINILLNGYTELGQTELANDLMTRSSLNDNSYRSILKGLKNRHANLEDIQEVWQKYRDHKGTTPFVVRDLQMLMRACFASTSESAMSWYVETLGRDFSSSTESADWKFLNDEVTRLQRSADHEDGVASHQSSASNA